jgi:hypothetical protein
MVIRSIQARRERFDERAEVRYTRREDCDAFDDLGDKGPFPKIASRVR